MHRHLTRTLLLVAIIFPMIHPVSAQTPDGPSYIVQPGDSLSSIASRFNIRVEDLMNANNISNPNLLAAGQQLIIPGLEGVTGVLDTAIINFGDSFRSLTRRTQAPVDIFQRLNRLISPSELYVGASMIVPRQEDASEITSTTPVEGESLLELAIRHKSDPWTVAGLNGLEGTWDGLPGDVLYTPGANSGQPATGLPPIFASAEIRGLPLRQGGTAAISITTSENASMSGMLADHLLHFYPLENGSQVALQGVHALLEPGVYPLRLDVSLPDDSRQSYEQMVLITPGNYNNEVIPLNDPSTIDPIVTEPELLQIEAITAISTPDRYWSEAFTSPAVYPDCFTSRYGTRRTYRVINTQTEIPGFHSGLDFCGGEGLPITAPAPGRVVFAQKLTVRGNATIIDHGWGVYSGIWHQSEIMTQVGELVEQGQVIGLVGGTGRATGAHLHWELWVNGVQVDPLDWLNQAYP